MPATDWNGWRNLWTYENVCVSKRDREREIDRAEKGKSGEFELCPRYGRILYAFVSRILKIQRTPDPYWGTYNGVHHNHQTCVNLNRSGIEFFRSGSILEIGCEADQWTFWSDNWTIACRWSRTQHAWIIVLDQMTKPDQIQWNKHCRSDQFFDT